MSVHEYDLNFTQLSRYALSLVLGMKSKMSIFVSVLSHLSSKEAKGSYADRRYGHSKADDACATY